MYGNNAGIIAHGRDESPVLSGRSVLLAWSREEGAVQTRKLAEHLLKLGFSINWGRNSVLPSQTIVYLGVELNSVTMRAQLSKPRADALLALILCVKPHSVVTVLSVT
ncbi:hypothetical protein GOODEAATRI_031316 [Goodea atripinnis]|uniref:Maturase R n=1 Tax=Goodea atripinnis TaxID=208336 RepID=A0ABV0MNG2_9TELE